MGNRKNFSEKTVAVFNPLPAVTTQEVIKRAGLENELDAADEPFVFLWTYGYGEERENLNISPGEPVILRENEAKMYMDDKAEEGCVVITDMNDPEEVRLESLRGLRRARDFWQFRGTKQLVNIRKNLEIGKEELEDYKVEHWRLYYNEALKDICKDEIEAITKKPEKTAKKVQTSRA